MGLAPVLVERIFEIIRDINTQGTTILLVEQNANIALEIATRGTSAGRARSLNSASADVLREDLQSARPTSARSNRSAVRV